MRNANMIASRFTCETCGSERVLLSQWYDPNTNKKEPGDGPLDYGYCKDCQEERGVLAPSAGAARD